MSNAKVTMLTPPERKSTCVRLGIVALFAAICVVGLFVPKIGFYVFAVFGMFTFLHAFWHGNERYGMKNMLIFFVLSFVVSTFFEALSVRTGFPFGNYHYNIPGPSLLDVPLTTMILYFGMGYLAWSVGHVLTGQCGKKLEGLYIFLTPFVGAAVMVMWDVVMDPINSTLADSWGGWVWHDGGNYFGVPISNYLGWYFVVYLFMQLYALVLTKTDPAARNKKLILSPMYWMEAVVCYGVTAFFWLEICIGGEGHREIYSSLGLVCVFTMIFTSVIAVLLIVSNRHSTN